jgi:membrane protein
VASGIVHAFVKHNLLTYTAAIAFQALVALVPLTLLGLALLGVAGLRDEWTSEIAPGIHGRVTPPVFHAIDSTVRRIIDSGGAGVIALALLLSLWYLAAAVRAVMEALNKIHDVEDRRPWWRRLLLAVGLAVVCGLAILSSALVVALGPRAGGAMSILFGAGRWLIAIALLGLAVGILVRAGPAEHPQPRWASAGSLLVIAFWICASVVFRFWVTSVADFRSPVGSLTGLLLITGYLYSSAAIFLVGVQLDELLRKRSGSQARNLLKTLRTAVGR